MVLKMIDKDLRKLSRKQLLELLLKQTERADELEMQLLETQKKLQDKLIVQTEAGSIAEAALKLNGIFEAAEAAAAQYIENVQGMSQRDSSPESITDLPDNTSAEEMIKETELKCAMREAKAEKILKKTYIKLRRLQKEIDELEKKKMQN